MPHGHVENNYLQGQALLPVLKTSVEEGEYQGPNNDPNKNDLFHLRFNRTRKLKKLMKFQKYFSGFFDVQSDLASVKFHIP